jgi:hypothetical protein
MIAICGTINDRLTGRYGDNLYVSFIDPVVEDKAARNTEMQTAVGSQPLMTVDEGREAYLGLGPTKGGDVLMKPTAMGPATETGDDSAGAKPKPGSGKPQPEDDPNSKGHTKLFIPSRTKAANGIRVGYRPSRTKFQTLSKKRTEQAQSLAETIVANLQKKWAIKTKAFESTKEQDEQAAKELSEYTQAAEAEVATTMKKLNGEQKAEVLANLEKVTKGIDPTKLFDMDNWISITTSAILPIMETLSAHQAAEALAAIGDVDTTPYSDTLKASVHESVQMMAESYNKTTLETLESKINQGLQEGESLADITKRVEEIYEWSDNSRAPMVAKTESFRATNTALKTAWKSSGVVKTVRWFTSGKDNVCPFCLDMDGKVIPIDGVFFKNGESLTVDDGGVEKTMSFDYGDIEAGNLHPNCGCFIRPQEVSID